MIQPSYSAVSSEVRPDANTAERPYSGEKPCSVCLLLPCTFLGWCATSYRHALPVQASRDHWDLQMQFQLRSHVIVNQASELLHEDDLSTLMRIAFFGCQYVTYVSGPGSYTKCLFHQEVTSLKLMHEAVLK